MKRFISVLLCLAMLMAFATVVSAEEPETGFTAPQIIGVQKGTAYDSDEDGTDDSVNLRFVSGLTDLKGEKLGYEIKAQFVNNGKGQSVVYKGDDMETDTVYSAILADGETVTAESKGCTALFALVMEVPVTLDIIFTATAYIKANGEKAAVSEEKQFIFSNGEFTERKVIMAEDFNGFDIDAIGTSAEDAETVKAAIETATGWTVNACGTSKPEYPAGMVSENGVLKIYGGGSVNHYALLPTGTLSKYETYTIEMDLNVEKMNNKMIIFALHPKYNSPSDTVGRSNEIRFRDYTTEARSNTGGTNGYLGMEYNLGTANASKPTKSDLGLTGSGLEQNFHMEINVNTATKALSVTITPEGEAPIQVFSTTMTVEPDGGFMIGVQQSIFTIDNLVITSKSEVAKNVEILNENFDDMTINSKGTSTADTDTVKAAIEAATGWTANACGTSKPEYPAGMVSENGALKIYGGSGVNNYTVLPKGTLSKYDAYSIEMDLNVEAANAKMVFFALHEKYASTDRSNEIRLRTYTNAERTTLGGTNDYLGMQYSFVAGGGTTKNVGSDFGLSGSGFGQNFHMRVEVDTNAMTIAVFVTPEDGVEEQIFSDMMSVVPDGGFLIGIQQAVITIDNLIIRSK